MPGKKIVLTPLAARKRLLLAESELNRELLAHEWEALADGAREATRAIRKTGALVLSLSALVSGFSLFRKIKSESAQAKSSWLSKLFQAARMGLALWGTIGSARKQTFPS